MLVSVSGFGYSGSGAVLDLLKEYSGFNINDAIEMSLFCMPSSIPALEQEIVLNASQYGMDIAVEDFLAIMKKAGNRYGIFRKYNDIFSGKLYSESKKYVDTVCNIKWPGIFDYKILKSPFISQLLRYRFLPRLEKAGIRTNWSKRTLYFSTNPENFYANTQNYLEKLLIPANSKPEEIAVYDQLVPVIQSDRYLKYFKNIKCILVDRNPIDHYLACKCVNGVNFLPCSNVYDYIAWYKYVQLNMAKGSSSILRIKFEDVVFLEENIVNEIGEFLQIKMEKNSIKKWFMPAISIANTNMERLFPQEKENVNLIKEKLGEYLYDFPEISAAQNGSCTLF